MLISTLGALTMVGAPGAIAQSPPDTTQPPLDASAPPPPDTIAQGVSIGGVDVSGLTRDDARRVILRELVAPKREPIPVAFRGRFLQLQPVYAGYVARVDYALQGALNFGRSRPQQVIDVPLKERIRADRIRRILDLDNSAWRAMSAASYGIAQEFDWDRSAEKLELALFRWLQNAHATDPSG